MGGLSPWVKKIDPRPVLFIEPLEQSDAETVVDAIGGSTSEEAGHRIALAISAQAIHEARIQVEETHNELARMAEEGISWTMVEPVYSDGDENSLRPENRPANSSFWRAITKIMEPLRATLAPFTD